ncbi:hypothetical protein SELR_pSRC400200 (plasmid) [Selenomonas ruminantium subsp. lactilytica TAM6421]|uniref:Helix-turn-helix domain-containing protein n=1 Tax=Selenomonas ruminantium subsp. lactilytica (strain NBRC 103574 / TAM6421) TaxID=927704 RepID=I0GV84_SELRL|nr:hypothetical protein [Selenomonas ruminantium]BAL84671.1 hypothetical protein SELR_pSRC400200 [Selenomonas ruminantium subsp. lactilytica TAM6421]
MGANIVTGWQLVSYAIKSGKVSHSAAVLLFVLIDKWNALHRPFSLNMTNAALMQMAHFGSHVSLDKAKHELEATGFIVIKASKKRFGTEYKICFGAWPGMADGV